MSLNQKKNKRQGTNATLKHLFPISTCSKRNKNFQAQQNTTPRKRRQEDPLENLRNKVTDSDTCYSHQTKTKTWTISYFNLNLTQKQRQIITSRFHKSNITLTPHQAPQLRTTTGAELNLPQKHSKFTSERNKQPRPWSTHNRTQTSHATTQMPISTNPSAASSTAPSPNAIPEATSMLQKNLGKNRFTNITHTKMTYHIRLEAF